MSLLEQAKQFIAKQTGQQASAGVLGVDIGSSSIKLVQLHNENGAALLETYGEIALGPFGDVGIGESVHLAPDIIAKALKQLMEGAGVTATACGVSIPLASSFVKVIEVPALDEKKLATLIPIEARKYVPVAMDEVQLDWLIVPETEQRLFQKSDGGTEAEQKAFAKRMVLLVAMHNSVLEMYAEILRLAGLKPLFFEIEAFSNMRATIDRSLAPVAILDIGAATSKLYVVELGIILASHVIHKGSQDVTRTLASSTHVSIVKAEELKRQIGIEQKKKEGDSSNVSHAATLTMEQIFTEARRALAGFQARYDKAITKVVLTGGGGILHGLEEFAQHQLELEVEIAKPFTRVQAPAFLDTLFQQSSPDFAVAVGLALRALQESE